MIPLIVLLTTSLIARLIGFLGVPYLDSWASAASVGLAVMLALTSSAHFTQPRRDGLIAIVPPRLPRPDLLVTVTGVLEALGAVGLLVPATRPFAAIGLALLFLAMFPANVRAASGKWHEHAPTTPLVPRTLIQLLFLASTGVVLLG